MSTSDRHAVVLIDVCNKWYDDGSIEYTNTYTSLTPIHNFKELLTNQTPKLLFDEIKKVLNSYMLSSGFAVSSVRRSTLFVLFLLLDWTCKSGLELRHLVDVFIRSFRSDVQTRSLIVCRPPGRLSGHL